MSTQFLALFAPLGYFQAQTHSLSAMSLFSILASQLHAISFRIGAHQVRKSFPGLARRSPRWHLSCAAIDKLALGDLVPMLNDIICKQPPSSQYLFNTRSGMQHDRYFGCESPSAARDKPLQDGGDSPLRSGGLLRRGDALQGDFNDLFGSEAKFGEEILQGCRGAKGPHADDSSL